MIGANHTGKSVTTKKIITAWRSARPDMAQVPGKGFMDRERKYKVIAFDPKKQFDGLVDHYIYPDKNWASDLNKQNIRNALIILDDYKTLIPNYIPTPGMFKLFSDRWHYNLDFIISCHSPGHVIDMIIDYITEYYVFHTKTSEGKFKEKMPNAEMLLNISKFVNKYVSVYGMGMHPSHPNFFQPPNNGQKFPYMVFNTTTPDAKPRGFNMRKDFSF